MALDRDAERVLEMVRSSGRPPYDGFLTMGKIWRAAEPVLDQIAAALRAAWGNEP